MTETEINQAIAEALGWKWWKFQALDGSWFQQCIKPTEPNWMQRHGGIQIDTPIEGLETDGSLVPNFYRDLNACKEMREFIKKDPKLIHKYQGNASIVLGKRHAPTYMELMDASAPEHCEIFLRTIGKWKE